MKGSRGDDEFQWGSRLGLAEDGMGKAKRPVAPVHVPHGAMYSTLASPGSRPALGIRSASIQPRKEKGE